MHESPVPQTKTALKSVSVFGSEDQFKLVIQQIGPNTYYGLFEQIYIRGHNVRHVGGGDDSIL